jgi:carbon monoxide dehydrogenase subunit G
VVEAGIETTWEMLLDLSRVAQCLPGATIEPADKDGSYRGTMKVKLGPVSMKYEGVAVLTEVDETSRTAAFNVQGKETRGQGTATATIRNSLVAEGTSTRVRVETEMSVTGRPAQFGRGIMQDVAGRMLSDFAACLSREISAQQASSDSAALVAEEAGLAAAAPVIENDVLDLSGAVGTAVAGRVWRGLGMAALAAAVAAVVTTIVRRIHRRKGTPS